MIDDLLRPTGTGPRPEPDGFRRAVADGARRRRCRMGGGAAATTVALVLALGLALPGGGSGAARLTPDESAAAPPAGSAAPSARHGPTPPGAGAKHNATPPDGELTANPPEGEPPPAPPEATPSAPPVVPERIDTTVLTPDDAHRTDVAPPGGCVATWCLTARADGGSADELRNLVLTVCRGPREFDGRLPFDRTDEVDFRVLREGRVLWQWSAGRQNPPHPHHVDVEPLACVAWTTPWHLHDAEGRRAAPGVYELQARLATSAAPYDEWVPGYPFSVGPTAGPE
jgi:hypothetical protein